MKESEWRFLEALYGGEPLLCAMKAAPALDAATLLAEQLARGRFVGFALDTHQATASTKDLTRSGG
jgi:hypothetical protein